MVSRKTIGFLRFRYNGRYPLLTIQWALPIANTLRSFRACFHFSLTTFHLTMLAKRIIPCLDIKDGRTVKGINFENLRDAGDAVELGKWYSENGADELVFLDITATIEQRKTFAALVTRIAQNLNIPLNLMVIIFCGKYNYTQVSSTKLEFS